MDLTLQLFHDSAWHDAAILTIAEPIQGRHSPMTLGYDMAYAIANQDRTDSHACSLRHPVELFTVYRSARWMSFIDDIMPSGAARRYWITQLGLQNLPEAAQMEPLLAKGTIAPIGNMRIKEALPPLPESTQLATQRFALTQVCDRDTDFLEYAQLMGAASGGATGAGGEAPKLVLRCSADDQVWIDTFQDDPHNTDQHYLVKFPRGQRSEIDCDILRAEYHFYHELSDMGFDTICTKGMRLEEGTHSPSLWLPRFDVEWVDGQLVRHGVESVYSLLAAPPGSFLRHADTLRRLLAMLSKVQHPDKPFSAAEFVIEWVKRDLLNIAFGNSDNHGRNTAILKRPRGMNLAPIYDFAPMKADPEGIPRTTTWGPGLEEGGRFDWQAIATALQDLVPAEQLLTELGQLTRQLLGLRDRLAARGVPNSILQMPVMGFDYLDDKLKGWQLP